MKLRARLPVLVQWHTTTKLKLASEGHMQYILEYIFGSHSVM